MRVLLRYIAFDVLRSVGVTVAALVAVIVFVELVGQLDDVGTNDYGFTEALSYVALRLPRTVFEVLPPAALIGSLLSLGNFAVHRELVVMRASGVSHLQLLGAVGTAGVALLVVMVLLGESLAPSLGAYAREMRTRAMHDDLVEAGQSVWLRSGERIWNLRRQQGELDYAGGVWLFELDEGGGLRRLARADSAELGDEGDWLLADYAETVFVDGGVDATRRQIARESYDFNPELLGWSVVREDLLDTPALRRYIAYLEENGLDATRYEIAYWSRMSNAVSVVLMTVLALPFAFGGLRSAGTGGRVLVGLVIGLVYYIATQMLETSAEVFELDPAVVAWAPSAALLLVAAVAFVRLR